MLRRFFSSGTALETVTRVEPIPQLPLPPEPDRIDFMRRIIETTSQGLTIQTESTAYFLRGHAEVFNSLTSFLYYMGTMIINENRILLQRYHSLVMDTCQNGSQTGTNQFRVVFIIGN